MKKKTEKTKVAKKEVEIPKPEYIKNISDYSQCSILFDEIINPKSNDSLLDLAVGANPYNHLIIDSAKESKEVQKEKELDFIMKSALLVTKILSKNLVMVLSIAKTYTEEDLEQNPNVGMAIVSQMFSEFILFKKKFLK